MVIKVVGTMEMNVNVNGVHATEVAGRRKVKALERRKRKWVGEKDLGYLVELLECTPRVGVAIWSAHMSYFH